MATAKKSAPKKATPQKPKEPTVAMTRKQGGEWVVFDAPKDDVLNMLANGWVRA